VAAPNYPKNSVASRLFAEGHEFSFFQGVRLLEQLFPERKLVGYAVPPLEEVLRFRAHVSLAFPPSSIFEIKPREPDTPLPVMTVTFLGMMGPNGVLPRHYTEMLLKLYRDTRGPERTSLRDWLDIFNHRFIAFFYRAWAKYRVYAGFERSILRGLQDDPFGQAVFSLIGMGTDATRNRLRMRAMEPRQPGQERVLAPVEDLGLLRYAGLLGHRPRNAAGLAALLRDFFGFAVDVKQFQGQWLQLDRDNQSSLSSGASNNGLGVDAVAGERVWDVQGKFRVRVGPLDRDRFTEFLPDRSPVAERKGFFLLLHLTRLYVGPEFAFDVQLILKAADIPACSLDDDGALGARLGWNTWLTSQESPTDADDPVFEGDEIVWVNR
jgi:type VI secretion system protein ImpH